MIESGVSKKLFDNNLYKNSTVQDIINLNNFCGESKIVLDVGQSCFGFLSITAEGVVGSLNIYYGDITIFRTNNNCEKLVPIKFLPDTNIVVSGQCEQLIICIGGAKRLCCENNLLLPLNNLLSTSQGDVCLYQYSSVNDVLDNDLVFLNSFGSSSFIQSYFKGNDVFIGWLEFSFGLYFCTSINNYTEKLEIANNAVSAIFLQNCNVDCVNFLYLKNGNIYCKTLMADGSLSVEFKVEFESAKYAIQLISSTIYCKGSRFFGVKYSDGTIIVYMINSSNSLTKIYELKAKSIRLLEFDNVLKIIVCNDYETFVNEYSIVESAYCKNVLSLLSSKKFTNVIDYFEIGVDKVALSTSCEFMVL